MIRTLRFVHSLVSVACFAIFIQMYAYVTRLMHFTFQKINRKSSLLSEVKLMFASVSPHFIDNGKQVVWHSFSQK